MLLLNNLQGNEYVQLQSTRIHNVGSQTSPSDGANKGGLIHYYSNEPYFWNGSAWIKFRTIASASDLPLANGSFYVGNGSNVAAATAKSAIPLSGFGNAAADVSMGSYRITGLGDPSGNTDAANKQYVDSVAAGLDAKDACNFTTTGNITLSGLAVQGNGDWASSLSAGDRILVKNQTTQSQNGIYIAAVGGWTRSSDFDNWAEVPGAFTFVFGGSTLAATGWVCTSVAGGTIGSSAVTWSQFSGASSYTAGNGIVLNGGAFHFGQSSNYTQGSFFYANSTTTVTQVTPPVGDYIMAYSTTLGRPWYLPYALPEVLVSGDVNGLLFCYSTGLITVKQTVADRILTTDGTGALQWSTSLPSGIGAALTKTNDTNVTLTLGGSPTTALLAATSLTLGWTGQLAMSRGGTGANLTNDPGGIVYCGAGALAVLADGTSGTFLVSGGTGAPSWFNLWSAEPLWVSPHEWQVASGYATHVYPPNPSSGTWTDSPLVGMSGKGNNAGTIYWHRYNFYVDSTAYNTAQFVLQRSIDTGTPSYSSIFVITNSNNIETAGDSLKFKRNGTYYGLLDWSTSLTANRTITLPNISGTVMLVDGGQTITSGVWQGTVVSMTYGGTGANITASNGGIVYSGSSTMAVLAGNASARRLLFSGASAAPTWSPYSMPATVATNSLFYASSTSAVSTLSAVNSSVLTTTSGGVPTWIPYLPTRNSIGFPRKYSNRYAGDNTNAYITVTHGLGTTDVVVSVRQSDTNDTTDKTDYGDFAVALTGVTVMDTNSVRLYFASVQASTTFYAVTVIG